MTGTAPSVVVGYDGSPDAEAALQWAASWTRAHDGTLTIVSVWEWPSFQGVPIVFGPIDPRQEIKESVETAAAATGLPDTRLRTVVEKGSPAGTLIDQSRDADLLVVGCRGEAGLEKFLMGSVSKQCALHAHCAVAVIRR